MSNSSTNTANTTTGVIPAATILASLSTWWNSGPGIEITSPASKVKPTGWYRVAKTLKASSDSDDDEDDKI
ncbi:hypothetical protein OPT61_g1834 [Boeremia exigua]|uniref:Uncharacterized protein n=1 Tax=Boeremia exigua TaxID=749465 RepID=A0ACC2INP8_9PLEO|nr:hypothetical protein OPT61_g1834 [Boeremia exigua]